MPIGGQICNGAAVRGRQILEHSYVQMPSDRNRLGRRHLACHPLALLFALRTPPERTRFRKNVPNTSGYRNAVQAAANPPRLDPPTMDGPGVGFTPYCSLAQGTNSVATNSSNRSLQKRSCVRV